MNIEERKINQQAEQAVLAALKLDNAAYDKIRLSPGDFREKQHRPIYQAITNIIEQGQKADDITITEELRKMGETPDTAYISSLDVPTAANVEYYAGIVRESSRKNQLSHMIDKAKENLKQKDSEEILEELDRGITEITDHAGDDEIVPFNDLLHESLSEVERLYQSGGGYTGIESGFKNLDYATNGFQNGDLIILAARASIGKTALALNMAAHMMLRCKKHVGFFSLEMPAKSLIFRLFAAEGLVDLWALRSGKTRAEDWTKLQDTANSFYGKQIEIVSNSEINLSELRSKARQMKRRGTDILFVDYLSLVKHPDRNLPHWQKVGEVSKALKHTARELDVPVIALSQLTRDAEGRTPNLSQLRYSGALEEDADLVLLLEKEREKDEAKLHIEKNRNGPLGTIDLVFKPEFTRFFPRESNGRI